MAISRTFGRGRAGRDGSGPRTIRDGRLPFRIRTSARTDEQITDAIVAKVQATGKDLRRLAAEAPVRKVNLRGLIATQWHLSLENVKQLRGVRSPKNPITGKKDELPLVLRIGSRLYIKDGHHRLTAAWLNGRSSARVKLLSLPTPARRPRLRRLPGTFV